MDILVVNGVNVGSIADFSKVAYKYDVINAISNLFAN